ncbi:MAG: tetratricopeptide repeat protein [Candidatus Eiseniibacteriota bacterium]
MSSSSRLGALVALVLASVSLAGGLARAAKPAEQVAEHLRRADQRIADKAPLEAADELQAALELDPENGDIHRRLGDAFLLADDLEKAVKVYRRWVDMLPNDCRAHRSLGLAYLKQGLTDQGIVSCEKGLALCPEEAGAFTDLARAYHQGGYAIEAIEACRRALELQPEDLLAHETLANLYYERKLAAEAIASYEAILARPDHGRDADWVTWVSRRIGKLYQSAGECDRAIVHFRTVRQSEPFDDETIRALAACYGSTGQTSEAIGMYDALVAERPDTTRYYYELAEVLLGAGLYDRAFQTLETARGHEGGCGARAHALAGRVYEKMGGVANYQAAEAEFRRCVECRDAELTEYCERQIERQQQLVRLQQSQK